MFLKPDSAPSDEDVELPPMMASHHKKEHCSIMALVSPREDKYPLPPPGTD
jgi:hypothetical protein